MIQIPSMNKCRVCPYAVDCTSMCTIYCPPGPFQILKTWIHHWVGRIIFNCSNPFTGHLAIRRNNIYRGQLSKNPAWAESFKSLSFRATPLSLYILQDKEEI